MRLVVVDGFDADRLRRGRTVEGTVADFELDDILAGRLERPGDGENGKRGFDLQRGGERAERVTSAATLRF